jgi:hypothetical protein
LTKYGHMVALRMALDGAAREALDGVVVGLVART